MPSISYFKKEKTATPIGEIVSMAEIGYVIQII